MAKNPLWTTEYYLLSNMYDDSLLGEFFRKISSESYNKSIQYQQDAIGRTRFVRDNRHVVFHEKLSEMIIDEKYNGLVEKHNNLPAGSLRGSRSLHFKSFILPILSKEKFYRKYGVRYPIIDLKDFYTNPAIFSACIRIQIGQYRIFNASFVLNIDSTVSLLIKNDSATGIPSNMMNNLISNDPTIKEDEEVWVFIDEQAQTYSLSGSYSSLFSQDPSDTSKYDLTIPLSSALNSVKIDSASANQNSWDIYITSDPVKLGSKILVSGNCSLKEAMGDNLLFSVDSRFIEPIIRSNATGTLVIINRHARKHILLCEYSPTLSPVVFPNFDNNPPGNINIEVYEFDMPNYRNGRRLYRKDIAQLYFPNILDFSDLIDDPTAWGELLIEIYEYPLSYTSQKMRNNLDPLIKSLGEDSYAAFVAGTTVGSSWGFRRFSPNAPTPTYAEYMASDWVTHETDVLGNPVIDGDLRGYTLSKLSDALTSDPYTLSEYYAWMHSKDPRVYTKTGSVSDFHLYDVNTGDWETVMDTSISSITPTDISQFSEPHVYIEYKAGDKKIASMLYINGKYVIPTTSRFYRGTNYIFIPVSAFDEVDVDNPIAITIDIFPNAAIDRHSAPDTMFNVDALGHGYTLFHHNSDPYFTLGEICMYDNLHKEFIDWRSKFHVLIDAVEVTITNTTQTNKVVIPKSENISYLLTSLKQYYSTMDEARVILNTENVKINLNEYLARNGYQFEDFENKRLNFMDVEFVAKDPSLLGMTIIAHSTKYKSEYVGTVEELQSEGDPTVLEVENFSADEDTNNYVAFCNGLLIPDAQFSLASKHEGATLSIRSETASFNPDDVITVVHIPTKLNRHDWQYLMNGDSPVLMYMQPAQTMDLEQEDIVNYLWPSDGDMTTDGVIIKIDTTSTNELLPAWRAENLKFSNDGFRMPPVDKSTNTFYSGYYSPETLEWIESTESSGVCFSIPCDKPIVDYNTFGNKNPLDKFFA